MREKILALFIVGFLLTTTPVIVGVEEENLSGESSVVEGSSFFNNDTFNESIEHFLAMRPDNESDSLPYFVPGELIVKFSEDVGIGSSELLSLIESSKASPLIVGGEIGSTSKPSLLGKEGVSSDLGSFVDLSLEKGIVSMVELFSDVGVSSLSNVFKLTFPSNADIVELARVYSSDESVVYAEPNYLYTTSYAQKKILREVPNDPMFTDQWALDQVSDCDIDAPEGWSIEKGDEDVVIAIVDTGVDYNHPDLAANIWHDPVSGNPGYDFVDIDTQMYLDYGFRLCSDEDYTIPDSDPMDVFGHGTHCAGIAGAVSNNSLGVAGVGWNCNIMPVRAGFKLLIEDFFGNWFETAVLELDDIAYSIVYATDKDADVISMSYGGFISSNLEKDVINYAYSNDVILVGAAGNDNTILEFYPAAYEKVIAVAASDNNDDIPKFSNYGDWVDIAAPGVEILSTVPNGGYEMYSGTSMACPHVAGLAGLLIYKNPNSPYPTEMTKSLISFTSDNIQTDKDICGRVNAFRLLNNKAFALKLEAVSIWEDVKGTVDIKGIAWGEEFQYYVLEEGLGESPSSWTTLSASSTPNSGVLLSLDSTQLVEGLHTVRLRVVCDHGVYSDETLIYVNNLADGSYTADIYVSNCYDSSTPGFGVTRFSSIQDGIDNTRFGDTVFVYDGIYEENINWSFKTLKLIGQSNNFTIVNGGIFIFL